MATFKSHKGHNRVQIEIEMPTKYCNDEALIKRIARLQWITIVIATSKAAPNLPLSLLA